jgi:glutathione S-transferase
MRNVLTIAATAALALTAAPLAAQTTTQEPTARDRIGSILGSLFGTQTQAETTLEAQWAVGQSPLGNQRAQFESRVDTDVRSGALTQAVGARLKTDYAALVQLEASYGADRRFTSQERTELADRYGALTQVLASGGAYAGVGGSTTADVAGGRTAFNQRVDAAVTARRISRAEATRIKNDYAALVQTEAGYLRDGQISQAERSDIDARLDALDGRIGDTAYAVQTPKARLDAIAAALPRSGLTATVQNQIRVEHGDLARLDAAYARVTVSAEERAYLDRRLGELEARVNLRR